MSGIEDLVVWREAASLAANVAKAAECLRGPHAWKVADQIVRAANSIQANLAEGYGRGTTPDGVRLLRYARASADELEGHVRAIGLNRQLPKELVDALVDQTRRVGYLLYRFMQSVQKRLKPSPTRP